MSIVSSTSIKQLPNIPEANEEVLSFYQTADDVPNEACRDMANQVWQIWSQFVLQRASNFHETFESEAVVKLVLDFTGDYYQCCKVALAVEKKFVFCPPPLGKPDPSKTIDPNFLQPRPRVNQKPQKGPTCTYYAMMSIAPRIGKKPLPFHEEERIAERLVSARRKCHLNLNYVYNLRYFADKISTLLKVDKITKEVIRANFAIVLTIKNVTGLDGKALNDFMESKLKIDFLEYVHALYYKASIQIESKFLTKIICPQILEQYYVENFQQIFKKQWSEVQLYEEQSVLQALADEVSFKIRQLQASFWHPSQEIDQLISELWLHGPHMIGGYFGKVYYIDEPILLKDRIQNRKIYAWPVGAKRKVDTVAHSVVIVGANKVDKRVYYIDPQDGSNPAQPDSAKVYATSYETLRKNIITIDNLKPKIPTPSNPYAIKINPNGPNKYALHGNPRINYL